MKNIFLVILALMLGNCTPAQNNDSTWTIGNGYIGRIVINMEESILKNIFSEKQIIKKVQDEVTTYTINDEKSAQPMFELETMCMDICIVSRIICISDKYKTAKGIGVGNTISDLKKYYTVSKILGDDKGIMIYVDELPQTAFIVKPSKIKAVPEKTYKASEIPDDSIIGMIYMY